MSPADPIVIALAEQLLAKGEDVHVEVITTYGVHNGKLEGFTKMARSAGSPIQEAYHITLFNVMRRQPIEQYTASASVLDEAFLKKDGGGWLLRVDFRHREET